MFTKSLIAAAFAVVAVAATPARANLITNGSFEQTTVTGKDYFAGHVSGWSGGNLLTFIDAPGTADNHGYLSVYGPFPTTSPDGGKFVEADGDPLYSSAITQSISGLVKGQSYTLSFYQAAGQQDGFTGATTERWQVSFGDQTQLSSMFSLPQGGVGPWQQQTMTFVASAATEVLSFLASGTPDGAPPISFLDGVTLNATPAKVPEPATLALVGTGLLGVFAARRRAKTSR